MLCPEPTQRIRIGLIPYAEELDGWHLASGHGSTQGKPLCVYALREELAMLRAAVSDKRPPRHGLQGGGLVYAEMTRHRND